MEEEAVRKPAKATDYIVPILIGLAIIAHMILFISLIADFIASPGPLGGAIGFLLSLVFEAPVVGVLGIVVIIRTAMKKIRFKTEWILMIVLFVLWLIFIAACLLTANLTTL